MRIRSIHPKYLDSKGLVALRRETLLARHVLEGKTKGYKNHPQLDRFKRATNPLESINYYLSIIFEEAEERDYSFDKAKIHWKFKQHTLPVTKGQLLYEQEHLLKKLLTRSPDMYAKIMKEKEFVSHPLFVVVPGNVEEREIITSTI